MIKLGDKVKDIVSLFKDVIVAETPCLYGCKQLLVELKNSYRKQKFFVNIFFNEKDLEVFKVTVIKNQTF